jgi:hypothetical protein
MMSCGFCKNRRFGGTYRLYHLLQEPNGVIGETDRPLAVWFPKHRHNLKEGLLEKSKLSQHGYEEDHRVIWDEARIFGD